MAIGFTSEQQDNSSSNGKANKRIYAYSPMRDHQHRLTDNLTLSRLQSLLRQAEQGALDVAVQLSEEIEEKDAHLRSVADKRRNALTSLEWDIVANVDSEDEADIELAEEAATYIKDVLRSIDTFGDTLKHLSRAIGPNVAVSELIWENSELKDIVDIPFTRYRVNYMVSPQVRILTDDEPVWGIEPPKDKLIVHIPRKIAGNPFRASLIRSIAPLFLAKHAKIADWSTFCELYGMPIRIAKYMGDASDKEKQEMADMLENMGTNAWALFSDAVDLQFHEASGRNTHPYADLISWIERKQSILYLGQNLSTEHEGSVGSLAAAKAHKEVEGEILLQDIEAEASTLEQQLIRPLIRLRFPGQHIPIPRFRRLWETPVDRKLEAEILDVAINKLKLKIDPATMYEILELPAPENEESTAPEDPGAEPTEDEVPILPGINKE